MEKHTPHCKLEKVHTLIQAGQVRHTFTALSGAADVGVFGKEEMCKVILALTTRDFYKAMTTHADHRVWQDVYHGKTDTGVSVYVKLTVVEDLLIVSFKEL